MEIRTNVKRGLGKIKDSFSVKEMYKLYKVEKKEKNQKPKSYKDYVYIIKEGNKLMLDLIVNHSEECQLPYRLGTLRIIKLERNFKLEKINKWKVDYQQSKKEGCIIYYSDPYLRIWKWYKTRSNVCWKSAYKFVACRDAKRAIAKAIRNKVDYFA
jgi:hypothetical protein